jgi:hypothetical protein
MSFLDVLDSIGTGQRPAVPRPQQASPAIPKPVLTNGVKRKVDDAFRAGPERSSQPSGKRGSASGTQGGKIPPNASSQAASKNAPARVNSPASASAAAPAKAPPKGSYAALMAEAKAAQKQRAKSEVGQIKHQATAKERLSKFERRKRDEEERSLKAKLGKQPQHNSKVEKKSLSTQKQRHASSYKGTAKPAPPASSYKGTAGLPSQHKPSSMSGRHKGGNKSTRYDEYLGTDEEDEGDESEPVDIDNGYGSEASSDMEAGAFDMEEEESKALREARADDARELALENKLKQEKEERKRRLEALARKRR